MDINLLKRLIRLVEKSEIAEFSVQEGDLKVRISKNSRQYHYPPHVQTPQQYPQQVQVGVATTSDSIKGEEKETLAKTNLCEIKSPIVGTFYRAPAPDADPYVQVGDHVSVGSILCIVEAMKLMNEIESDVGGKIVKILVENSTPVEYNQPLFLIEKD